MKPEEKRGPEKNAKDLSRKKRLDKKINDVIGSHGFIDALEKARTDPSDLEKLKANPKEHLKGKGVDFGDEIEVDFTEGNSWSCCMYYYYWQYRVSVCYYYYW